MPELEEGKSALGLLAIFGLGAGLGALHLVHAVAEDESLVTFVSGILVPLLLSLGPLGGGVSFARSDLASEIRWCRRYSRPALGQSPLGGFQRSSPTGYPSVMNEFRSGG